MNLGSNVTKKAALVGALTGVSRILGLAREMLTARLFGAGVIQSAFVVAFAIPNLFRRLFGEGALSSAFVPAFTSVKGSKSHDEALTFAKRMMTLLATGLSVIVLVGVVGTLLIAPLLTPDNKWSHIIPFLQIMLAYAVLICMAALAMGILNVLDDFRTPAITPAILNIVWIFVLAAICPFLPNDIELRMKAVAWGVVFAGLIQFAFMWIALRKKGWKIIPASGGLHDTHVRNVLIRTLPAALGAGVIQINVCMDHLLAFWAAEWAPAALQYAERVVYLPMGLIATSFSTVLLPTFSRQFSAGDSDGAKETMRASLNDILFLMIPATAALIALAKPVISLLFEGNEFSANDTILTSRALVCYAPGLVFFSLQKVFNPLFFAMGDTATPTKVSSSTVGLNFALNVTLIYALPLYWKHAGIALSTVISSAVGSCILVLIAKHRIGRLGLTKCIIPTMKAILSACIMAISAKLIYFRVMNTLLSTSTNESISLAISMAITIVFAILFYFGLQSALSPGITQRFISRFRKRVK